MAHTFGIKRTIRFCETDMAGVVHFSNYFRMMEEVEHAFLRSLKLSVAMEYKGAPLGWPRISTSCQYFAPLRFEDEVQLALSVTKVGRKSLSYQVEFLLKGRRMALGKLTSVCCTMRDGAFQATPIPAPIRAKLGAGRAHPAATASASPTRSGGK